MIAKLPISVFEWFSSRLQCLFSNFVFSKPISASEISKLKISSNKTENEIKKNETIFSNEMLHNASIWYISLLRIHATANTNENSNSNLTTENVKRICENQFFDILTFSSSKANTIESEKTS